MLRNVAASAVIQVGTAPRTFARCRELHVWFRISKGHECKMSCVLHFLPGEGHFELVARPALVHIWHTWYVTAIQHPVMTLTVPLPEHDICYCFCRTAARDSDIPCDGQKLCNMS